MHLLHSFAAAMLYIAEMVGTVNEDHAHKDIDDAITMGLDGFVLNVGYPQVPYVYPTLSNLFGYTDYRGNFELLISMDLWAAGGVKHSDGTNVNAFDYGDTFKSFLNRPSYYKYGSNPMITTFSSGGMTKPVFLGWRQTPQSIHFVPDIEGTEGYGTSSQDWSDYWNPVIDGLPGWESGWPIVNSNTLGSTGPDSQPRSLTANQGKTLGGLQLIKRMDAINSMPTMADWVQIISWNDGPEGHYIGNLWPESNGDADPAKYASSTKGFHIGWQAIISSFITAFRNGDRRLDQWRTGGANPNNEARVGTMWYNIIRTGVSCNAAKPSGYGTATDKVSWAIVSNGGSLQVNYGGQTQAVNPGLNFGEFDLVSGGQRMELWEGSTLRMVANGGRCNYNSCPDGIYNLNPEVVSFKYSWGGKSGC